MGKDDKAVAKKNESALQAALAATISDVLTDGDYEGGQYEEPKLTYLGIRQKDLKDEKGKIVRPAGRIRAGSIKEPEGDDRDDLTVTVLASKATRTYFKTLNDPKPTCSSDDMVNGSAQRAFIDGRKVYGQCADCALAQWGSAADGRRQACQEGRKIFIMDWEKERPSVLSIGPSSLKPFKAFSTSVKDEARRFADAKGRVPVIFHLLQVKATPEYVAEPAGHFVLKWGTPVALPLEIQTAMAQLRKESNAMFARVADHEDEAETVQDAEVVEDATPAPEFAPPSSTPVDSKVDPLPF